MIKDLRRIGGKVTISFEYETSFSGDVMFLDVLIGEIDEILRKQKNLGEFNYKNVVINITDK